MEKLSTTELKVLNNMSMVLNHDVKLGDKFQEMIATTGVTDSPVNAVAAKNTLTLTGVVVHGETLAITNPATKALPDIYEFLADAAQSKSSTMAIAVDITAHTTKSSGALTIDVQPTSGDTVTIGDKTYIFVPVGTANSEGEVSIGANLEGAQAALVAAINGTDGINDPHPTVRVSAFAANISTITALIGGVAGDAIATIETFTAVTNVFGAATLGTGADCTAANAITALVAAITASDTQGVGAADGAGDTIDFTADVAGEAGNDITLATTMANAAFDGEPDTTLEGGVDGTVANGLAFAADTTYLYVCPNGNTIADANWRRIALGAAY